MYSARHLYISHKRNMRFCLVFCQYANSVLLCKVYTLQRIYPKISLSVCKTVFNVVYERVKSLEDASINALSGNSFIDLHAGDGGIDRCNVAITPYYLVQFVACNINDQCNNQGSKTPSTITTPLLQLLSRTVSTVWREMYSIMCPGIYAFNSTSWEVYYYYSTLFYVHIVPPWSYFIVGSDSFNTCCNVCLFSADMLMQPYP